MIPGKRPVAIRIPQTHKPALLLGRLASSPAGGFECLPKLEPGRSQSNHLYETVQQDLGHHGQAEYKKCQVSGISPSSFRGELSTGGASAVGLDPDSCCHDPTHSQKN